MEHNAFDGISPLGFRRRTRSHQTTANAIFIGGSLDGQLRVIKGNPPRYRAEVLGTEIRLTTSEEQTISATTIEYEEYIRCTVYDTDQGIVNIYATEEIRNSGVVKHLLDIYTKIGELIK